MEQHQHLLGETLKGTYCIERLIGRGGMGAVYEASHPMLPKHYAVKVLFPCWANDESVFARFQQEAWVTTELGHPNIVEVLDFDCLPDGCPYMVMELLDGLDLGQVLRHQTHLDLAQAGWVLHQAASALQAAHRGGVIHRDLKPANLFVCRTRAGREVVKVLDFGISKVMGSQSVETMPLTFMGSPNYMAPEQAVGHTDEADPRTDVFAMGAILYHMLTGHKPFQARGGAQAVLYKIIHEAPAPLRSHAPWLPHELEQVMERALAKDPGQRFRSMDQLCGAFEAATTLQDRPPASLLRSRKPKRSDTIGVPGTPTMLRDQAGPDEDPTETLHTGDLMPDSSNISMTGPFEGEVGSPFTGLVTPEQLAATPPPQRESRFPWIALLLVAVVLLSGAGGIYLGFLRDGQRQAPLIAGRPGMEDAQPSSPAPPALGKDVAPDSRVPLPAPRPLPRTAPARVRPRRVISKRPRRTASTRPRPRPAQRPGPATKPTRTTVPVKPAATHGSLDVYTSSQKRLVWTDVFLDGQHVGQTPLILKQVSPGSHRLKVTRGGYVTVSRQVTVSAGQKSKVLIELEKM